MKIWSPQEDKLLIALAAKGKATRSSLARLDTLAQFPGRTANALYQRLLALGVDRLAKTCWSDQEMMALEELSVSGQLRNDARIKELLPDRLPSAARGKARKEGMSFIGGGRVDRPNRSAGRAMIRCLGPCGQIFQSRDRRANRLCEECCGSISTYEPTDHSLLFIRLRY